MESVTPYLAKVRNLLHESNKNHLSAGWGKEINLALDGQPSREIRKLVPISELRQTGSFFTNKKLATFAFNGFGNTFSDSSVVFDPALGVGDLLLAAANHLPIKKTLEITIRSWGKQLSGFDINDTFVEIAKTRLLLKCIVRGKFNKVPPNLVDWEVFPLLQVGSSLDDKVRHKSATHIVLNPPFTLVESPENSIAGSGMVNAAAIFLEHSLSQAEVNARFLAILPDVLRSGSRYSYWRKFIEVNANINRIALYGLFDKFTDVDIFVMLGRKTNGIKRKVNWKRVGPTRKKTVEDYFYVSVGAVVDFRDPELGSWKKYLVARDFENWTEIKAVSKSRRFLGTISDPPFVVVKRTSRLGDNFRAAAAIVKTAPGIAVDNHLLVLLPKDGKLETCRKLLKKLRSTKTNVWLNKRIRCRHLTVSSVRELPW